MGTTSIGSNRTEWDGTGGRFEMGCRDGRISGRKGARVGGVSGQRLYRRCASADGQEGWRESEMLGWREDLESEATVGGGVRCRPRIWPEIVCFPEWSTVRVKVRPCASPRQACTDHPKRATPLLFPYQSRRPQTQAGGRKAEDTMRLYLLIVRQEVQRACHLSSVDVGRRTMENQRHRTRGEGARAKTSSVSVAVPITTGVFSSASPD